jgi:hypothetical protein
VNRLRIVQLQLAPQAIVADAPKFGYAACIDGILGLLNAEYRQIKKRLPPLGNGMRTKTERETTGISRFNEERYYWLKRKPATDIKTAAAS